ncbi:MAG: YhbY family RNA-binding protein [Oscillospiraceae bacterium]|jgi:RNA-binding protein|nr:YhbY family RNA-binding protein [Oscillospiraceae bacterium]MBR3175702.1 YhbY family RNA-binding protein [Oscillospiraceae bacterium]
MTGKERARLKSLASTEDTIIHVGKSGITPAVVASVDAALAARELVKGRVLESSMLTAREACEQLSEACGAEPVQAIGTKFVLYRKKKD